MPCSSHAFRAHSICDQRWNHLNPLPIHEIHERWIGPHAARATARLAKLKRELERQ
jgi:hypothetical protein